MMLTGDNGILQRAAEAKEITDIARVEEAANLELANSIIGAKTQQGGATEKTVAQIAEYLKDEGYIEDYDQTRLKTITGMTFGDIGTAGIVLAEGATSDEIVATFNTSNPSEDYYVQINGKKYLITKTNGKIKIISTEITIGTQPAGEITSVEASPEGVVNVSKVSGTTDKIQITGIAKGAATIVAKYTDEIQATIPVTVKESGSVTFNVNGGTFASGETGTRTGFTGEEMTLPVAPTAPTEGDIFKGWYTEATGGTIVYSKTSTKAEFPEGNIQVYAHYGADVATVDEVGNGTNTVWYKGSSNWELFFKDNGRTYLIYKNATTAYKTLKAPVINSLEWSNIHDNPGNYYSTSDNVHTHLTDYLVKTADSERFKPATQAGWLNKYMTWLGDGTTRYNDAGNMAFTLFMLDQNVWKYGKLTPGNNATATDYYDEEYADWVIGGPTMEMMVATANTLNNASYSCEVTKANGYTKNGLNSYSLERGTVWNHGNASNYYRYWLASPGDGQSIDVWILDGYQARLVKDNCFNTYGFRPVVCLKSGVNLTTEGAGIYGTTYVLTK